MTVVGGRKVIFIHIPKTAGTAVTYFLTRCIKNHANPYYGDFASYADREEHRDLLYGHFTHDDASRRFPNAYTITFLRDPIARAVSQYKSFHNPKKFTEEWRAVASAETISDMEFAQTATFEEFVFSERPHILGHLRNVQTEFLCDPTKNGEERLESALRNLERLQFVGLQEFLGASIKMLSARLGPSGLFRRRTRSTERLNVSDHYQIEITPKIYGRLYSLLSHDIRLYERARNLFDDALHQHLK